MEADQEEHLSHQDGKGQVGVDVIALVADGADGAVEREVRLASREEIILSSFIARDLICDFRDSAAFD